MSFCGLTKRVTPKICRLYVRVLINKRSFEPFVCLDSVQTDLSEMFERKTGDNWTVSTRTDSRRGKVAECHQSAGMETYPP